MTLVTLTKHTPSFPSRQGGHAPPARNGKLVLSFPVNFQGTDQ